LGKEKVEKVEENGEPAEVAKEEKDG